MTPTDDKRCLRLRSNSLTDGDTLSNLNFDKPFTLSKPGTYTINGPNSGCSISLFDNIFSPKYLQQLQTLTDSLPTVKQHDVTRKEGIHKLPRLSAWYGPANYEYSGVRMAAHDVASLPDASAVYRYIADNLLVPNGIANDADSFLINRYRNERDSCGEHSDNEPLIYQNSPIVTLSLGHPRVILIREKFKGGNAITITLSPGSVFVMAGTEFQTQFTHQIPKESQAVSSRTSYTFRKCDPGFLSNIHKATSTPLMELTLPVKLLDISTDAFSPSRLINRRKSQPFAKSPLASTNNSLNNSPSSSARSGKSTESRMSKTDSEMFPLSLQAITEAIDLIKESTLKQELSRYDLQNSGSLTERRKRLKKAVQDAHKKQVLDALSMQVPEVNADCVMNSITTLETSILDLQQEILTQRTTIESLVVSKPVPSQSSATPNLTKELQTIDKRVEKIEDSLNSLNINHEELTETISDTKKTLNKIVTQTSESCTRLRSLQHPEVNRPKAPPDYDRSPPARGLNQTPPNRNMRSSPPEPKLRNTRKVLVVHDSQLNKFDTACFSATFPVEKFKAGSYHDLLNTHMRNVISKPNIDGYVLQLGVNDYRYDPSPSKCKKAVEDTKKSIECLLERSNAKILVCLPTPTPGQLDKYTLEYVKSVSDFITEKRSIDNNFDRLFTLNNHAIFLRLFEKSEESDRESCNPLTSDLLHLNTYGMKKLCTSIKFGLYRSFGMRAPNAMNHRNPHER